MTVQQTDNLFIADFDQQVSAKFVQIICDSEILISNISYKMSDDEWIPFRDLIVIKSGEQNYLPLLLSRGAHVIELINNRIDGVALALEGTSLETITGLTIIPIDANVAPIVAHHIVKDTSGAFLAFDEYIGGDSLHTSTDELRAGNATNNYSLEIHGGNSQ